MKAHTHVYVILMSDLDAEQKITNKGRIARIQALEGEVKEKGKMKRDDIVRFGMLRWMLSRRVVEKYVDDLILMRKLESFWDTDGEYIKCPEA